jgi:hypothetical protein
LTLDGQHVDYSGSILIPGEYVIFYLFEACSATAVQASGERAGVRFARVVQCVRTDADAT